MDADAATTSGGSDSGGSETGELPGASDGPRTTAVGGVDDDAGSASGDDGSDLPACPGPDCTMCGTPETWFCLKEVVCPEGTLAEIDPDQIYVECFTGRCLAPEACDVKPACDCDEGSVCMSVLDQSNACMWTGWRCLPIPDGCDPDADPSCMCEDCDEPGTCGASWSDAPGDQMALECSCQDG